MLCTAYLLTVFNLLGSRMPVLLEWTYNADAFVRAIKKLVLVDVLFDYEGASMLLLFCIGAIVLISGVLLLFYHKHLDRHAFWFAATAALPPLVYIVIIRLSYLFSSTYPIAFSIIAWVSFAGLLAHGIAACIYLFRRIPSI